MTTSPGVGNEPEGDSRIKESAGDGSYGHSLIPCTEPGFHVVPGPRSVVSPPVLRFSHVRRIKPTHPDRRKGVLDFPKRETSGLSLFQYQFGSSKIGFAPFLIPFLSPQFRGSPTLVQYLFYFGSSPHFLTFCVSPPKKKEVPPLRQ